MLGPAKILILTVAIGCKNKGSTGDTGPDYSSVEITALDWELHQRFESLVYVSWEQSEAAPVHVEYSFDEDIWESSPSFDAEVGAQQQVLVGIPYDYEAEWRVVIDGGQTVEGQTITTGSTPLDLPLPSLEVSEPGSWYEKGNYLLTSINQNDGGWTGGKYWTFILDREGRPVWASRAPENHWTLFAQVALSGDHFLWDEASYWSDWDDGAASSVHRTYLDEEIEEIATPGLHHAFVQLPGDILVWGSQYHASSEALVEMGPDETDASILWTCSDNWSSSDGGGGGGGGGGGHCESNGIFYAEETDSFLYSFYTNNSLVEVDRATGESIWWAGEKDGGYDFDPASSQFFWQHGVSYTDAGTLLVSTASCDMTTGDPNEPTYCQSSETTMLREYDVNQDTQTLTETWSFDPGVTADTNGDAWRLENGHTLHVVGSAAHLYELDENSEIVWYLAFESDRLLGRGEFIEDLYDLVKPRQ